MQEEQKDTYSFTSKDGKVCCFKDPAADQTLTKLWETVELTAFHDAELAQATKEINAILSEVEESNKDSKRKLSFIRFQNRQLLVWASYAVGPHDDDESIIKALRLKVR